MKLEVAKALIAAAEEAGTDEVTLHEDYSGRGMFGATTTGLVLDSPSCVFALIAVASVRVKEAQEFAEDDSDRDAVELDWEDFCQELKGLKQDNLGRGTILY